MEENNSLKQFVSHCIDSACDLKGNPIPKNGVYSYFQKDVHYLVGSLQLQSSPFYSFVLEENGFKVNCVIIDVANNLVKWIKYHGKVVVIESGYIAVERFHFENECDKVFVSLVISGSNVHLIKKESICLSSDIIPNWKRLFRVQHVSTPLFVCETKPLCFVLVSFASEDKGENKKNNEIWLVLKGDQVSWKELLVPNREYLMFLPSSIDKDYFSRNVKQLSDAVDKEAKTFLDEIMHHPQFFPTLDAVVVPENASLYLQSNSCLSSSLLSESVLYQSLSQVESSNERILTVYGQIKSVGYELPLQVKGCSLCKKERHCVKDKSKCPVKAQKWIDPWTQTLTLPDNCDELGLQLPVLNASTNFNFCSSTPEKLTQKVVMEDIESGDEITLYIKNWHHYMRPMALSPGLILLAKFVNRCYSQRGNLYYTACALTSFQILQDNRESGEVETWGPYGFPHSEVNLWKKEWGILKMEKLIKVSLSAVCSNCNSQFVSGKCTSRTCKSSAPHTATASAVVQVSSLNGALNVMLKNDQVRIYLGIDESKWTKFCQVAGHYDLLYLRNSEVVQNNGYNLLQKCFFVYCSIIRPRRRFYISVRHLRTDPDAVPLCSCIYIEPFKNNSLLSDTLSFELSLF